MLKSKHKFIAVVVISWALAAVHVEGILNHSFAQSLLPQELTLNEIYEAGSGLPVGKIQSIWGDVVILHADMIDGYLAKVGLPLFNGDTIVTTENGSFGCKLNDGSTIRLASNSKLTINHSTHDARRKSSFSVLSLIPGNAYFKIAKLDEFEAREFKVETDVVVAGGRQADFIIMVAEGITEILALQATILQVASLEDPEQKIVLSDFQRAVILDGVLPATVEMIPTEEAAQLVSQFYQIPEGILSDMAMRKLREKEIFEDEDILEEDIEKDDFFIE
ncbi:MAG: FecR domain-containing protein [Desulfobacterales bacterium]|nr:MAG: FecR domain-containing protein [Desulfobacterales bacterium]